jgi:hypothetical protein
MRWAGVLWLWASAAGASVPEPSVSEHHILELNTASAGELAALPGLGAETAAAIVAYRDQRGGKLTSVEELRAIRLDETVLASLRTGTQVEVTLPSYPTGTDSPGTFDTVEAVMARFTSEPSVQQVQAWANDYANANPEQVDRWLAQARSFALMPEVTVDLRLRNDWDEGFEYFDPEGADPVPGARIVPVAEDADQGQTQEYKLRLRWRLDKLVMSSERIRVINEAQDIVKLRDKVLAEATRLYFDRRRLQVEMLLSPKIDLMARVKDELRLLELTANLDALTGGSFSRGVDR